MSYIKNIDIRWADLDPNFHVIHSRYYEFGAFSRMSFMTEYGLTPAFLTEHGFGPVIFKEECTFKKELRFGDQVTIDLEVLEARPDYSRWTLGHHIWVNNKVAAIIKLSGAWLDINTRKLVTPPEMAFTVFNAMPKSPDFQFSIIDG